MTLFRTLLFVAIAVMATFWSCKNSVIVESETVNKQPEELPVSIAAIQPPFENLDVPFTNYEIDPVKGDLIKMANGTVIKVPKNAFFDKNGNRVDGKVTIKYREFHDAASIIASGIPMSNRGDDSRYMETAGMFEIKGEANGDPVTIDSENTLEVSMASFVEGKNFDFFYLDEKECQWITKGTTPPVINEGKVVKERKIGALPEAPGRKPEKRNKENFVFDLDINYSNFAELKSFKNIIWEYAGGTPEQDPQKNPWIFDTDWTSVELLPMKDDKSTEFVLKLFSGNKTFVSYVRPVLSEVNYEAALSDFEKKNALYQKAKVAMKSERERLNQEADLLREFRISDFGVFNWDIWKMPKRILVKAQFDFEDAFDSDINEVSVFLVTGNSRSVVRYTPKDFDKFSFDPGQENKLIAVLPGNKVAVFDTQDFKELDLAIVKELSEAGRPVRFKMKSKTDAISSIDQLRAVIGNFG